MIRWIAALLALLVMISGCAALAECEGWAVARRDTQIRQTPDPAGEVLAKVSKGDELEYGGYPKYDDAEQPWDGVSLDDISGWIPGEDADLKWSTLY